MKIVKRCIVVLVLCLAVIGAFSLLKKAPNLNPSADDVEYLEKQFGKKSSTAASQEGLSGVMMNVEGAPPLGFTESNVVPPALLGGSAPAFHAEMADAPAFGAAAEAPAFHPAPAPPFVPAAPAVPIASPHVPPVAAPPVVPVEEAPAFIPVPPPTPVPTVQPAPVMPPISAAPLVHATPTITVLHSVPATPTPPVPVSFEDPPPIIEAGPFAWNGPATEVINMPSSVPDGPQEGSGVLGAGTFSSSTDRADMIGEPLRNETPIVAQSPYKRLPVVPKESVVKAIPSVVEEPLPPPPSSNSAPVLEAAIPQKPVGSGFETKPISASERYRQTSVRTDIAFASQVPPVREEQPVISFSTRKIEAPGPVTSTVSRNPVATPPGVETIPFAESDRVESNQVIPPPMEKPQPAVAVMPAPDEDLAKRLRPTVTRFVKAQGHLADSGDPIKMRNAFIQLSKLYEQKELNDDERAYMRPVLDRLALAIVYSRNIHVLESPYLVRSGDTVESIAAKQEISPALLMKINGITEAQPLMPGTELKVVLGRFDAKVSVSRRELTLILGGLYAGRFAIVPGDRLSEIRGEFYVTSKPTAPGERTMMLNNGVIIRGADQTLSGDPQASTTIHVSPQDARELFDILTEMSVVVFED